MGVQIVTMHRTYYHLPENTDLSDEGKRKFRKGLTDMVKYNELPSKVVPYDECNLIGSSVPDTRLHMPMFDVDDNGYLEYMSMCFPNGIWIPSRTPLHWHLYVQCAMPWNACTALLHHYTGLGCIDRVWAAACLDQYQMFLRKPICGPGDFQP